MNDKKKAFMDDWYYFCKKVNFGQSAMDAKAIDFMNTFAKRVEEL